MLLRRFTRPFPTRLPTLGAWAVATAVALDWAVALPLLEAVATAATVATTIRVAA
jgi:hypothetical protein